MKKRTFLVFNFLFLTLVLFSQKLDSLMTVKAILIDSQIVLQKHPLQLKFSSDQRLLPIQSKIDSIQNLILEDENRIDSLNDLLARMNVSKVNVQNYYDLKGQLILSESSKAFEKYIRIVRGYLNLESEQILASSENIFVFELNNHGRISELQKSSIDNKREIKSITEKFKSKQKLAYLDISPNILFKLTGVNEQYFQINNLLDEPIEESRVNQIRIEQLRDLKSKELEDCRIQIKETLRVQQKIHRKIVSVEHLIIHLNELEEKRFREENILYLDANGVTIKCYDWAKVGDIGTINGKRYLVVSQSQLSEMLGFSGKKPPLENICTSKVTDLSYFNLHNYDGYDISHWDVSNVEDMSSFFSGSAFNGDISHWDVSKVTDMSDMFYNSKFNQDISRWDVSRVTNMSGMFQLSEFNKDISHWDVSKVTDMSDMFYNSKFNQDISRWDVSRVEKMSGMFNGSDFNRDISGWNVSNVTNMWGMFNSSSFNGDISRWDVSSVEDMSHMFRNCSFHGDISNWDFSNVQNCEYFNYGNKYLKVDKLKLVHCKGY